MKRIAQTNQVASQNTVPNFPFFDGDIEMTLSEVVAKLKQEDTPNVTLARIRHALVLQRVPEPPRDGSGNRQFSAIHVRKLRQYLSQPHPRGRRRQPEAN